jgi:hypothetical protein
MVALWVKAIIKHNRLDIRVNLAEKPAAVYAPDFSHLWEVIFVEYNRYFLIVFHILPHQPT